MSTESKVLIPVRPDDMPVGSALPWPLYGRAGQLIAQKGFVVESPTARAKLLGAAPMREARGIDGGEARDFLRALVATADGADAPILPQTGARDALPKVRGNVESVVLTFQLPGDLEPRKARVAFIGRMPGQAVIVGAPPLGGGMRNWHQHDGLDVGVLLMCGRGMYTFESRVIRYAAAPGPHLFLTHPTAAVFKEIRASTRVPAKLPAVVQSEGGEPVSALIADLSGHGCGVQTEYLLGEPGAQLTLSFRVTVHGKAHTLSLPATLKNQRQRGRTVHAGLAFDESALKADWYLPLVLKSYVFERLLDA